VIGKSFRILKKKKVTLKKNAKMKKKSLLIFFTLFLSNVFGQLNDSPITWSTPGSYNDLYSNNEWSTLDMDGDGLPDLIRASDGGIFENSGNYYWNVYLNNGSGFTDSPITWSTPGSYNDLYSNNEWSTLDMNGDNSPDLIRASAGGTFENSGNYYWNVYLNTDVNDVGMEEADNASLEIFPNPSNGYFKVNYLADKAKKNNGYRYFRKNS
jgi:hypothetical protein